MKETIKKTIGIFFIIFILFAFFLMVFRVVDPVVFWISSIICAIVGFLILPKIK